MSHSEFIHDELQRVTKEKEALEHEAKQAKRGLIQIAARLVTCKMLTELEDICENQKSISTVKLQCVADKLSDKLKDEAVYIRNMLNKL